GSRLARGLERAGGVAGVRDARGLGHGLAGGVPAGPPRALGLLFALVRHGANRDTTGTRHRIAGGPRLDAALEHSPVEVEITLSRQPAPAPPPGAARAPRAR